MSQITVNPDNGQHSATLTQRELATLRVIASRSAEHIGDVMREIVGDCGDENCEKCSLDGDDAHDARYTLYGD